LVILFLEEKFQTRPERLKLVAFDFPFGRDEMPFISINRASNTNAHILANPNPERTRVAPFFDARTRFDYSPHTQWRLLALVWCRRRASRLVR
jgi:hypothetical protein